MIPSDGIGWETSREHLNSRNNGATESFVEVLIYVLHLSSNYLFFRASLRHTRQLNDNKHRAPQTLFHCFPFLRWQIAYSKRVIQSCRFSCVWCFARIWRCDGYVMYVGGQLTLTFQVPTKTGKHLKTYWANIQRAKSFVWSAWVIDWRSLRFSILIRNVLSENCDRVFSTKLRSQSRVTWRKSVRFVIEKSSN